MVEAYVRGEPPRSRHSPRHLNRVNLSDFIANYNELFDDRSATSSVDLQRELVLNCAIPKKRFQCLRLFRNAEILRLAFAKRLAFIGRVIRPRSDGFCLNGFRPGFSWSVRSHAIRVFECSDFHAHKQVTSGVPTPSRSPTQYRQRTISV